MIYILKSYCETDTHLSDLFELFFKAPTIVLLRGIWRFTGRWRIRAWISCEQVCSFRELLVANMNGLCFFLEIGIKNQLLTVLCMWSVWWRKWKAILLWRLRQVLRLLAVSIACTCRWQREGRSGWQLIMQRIERVQGKVLILLKMIPRERDNEQCSNDWFLAVVTYHKSYFHFSYLHL